MRPWWLAVAFLACGAPFAPPEGTEPIQPPPEYRQWWEASRTCVNKPEMRAFERIHWYVTPGPIPLSDGTTAAGLTVGSAVYVQAMYARVPWIIQHELVHAVNNIVGHPADPFQRCHLMTWQENQ